MSRRGTGAGQRVEQLLAERRRQQEIKQFFGEHVVIPSNTDPLYQQVVVPDLFGPPRLKKVKRKKKRVAIPPAPQKNTPGYYQLYGLDSEKRSKDEGSTGSSYCLFCAHQVSYGASMGFVHFVICPDCLIRGRREMEEGRNVTANYCFRCQLGDMPVDWSPNRRVAPPKDVWTIDPMGNGVEQHICRQCLHTCGQHIRTYQQNLNKIPAGTQLKLL